MTEQEIILKMARAMQPHSYWAGDRPHEKKLVTMATNAFRAIKPYIKIDSNDEVTK